MNKISLKTDSWIKRGFVAAFIGSAMALLTSCGGGGVSSDGSAIGGDLQVLPGTVDMYADQPVTFAVSGGSKPYTFISGNPTLVSIAAGANSNTFVGTAKNPPTDTVVALTVRDGTGKTAPITANVKATTLNNQVAIVPTALAPGTGCGNAVCSGGDASATVLSVLNGIVQVNRSVRFDVFQGDYKFVTPGTNALVTTLTAQTDEQGNARVILRANVTAQTQTAILQVVDVPSGLTRRFTFLINQFTDGAGSMTVFPATVTWTGPDKNNCAAGGLTNHFIFGGTPPYTINNTSPDAMSLAPTTVTTNGGSVTSVTTGACGTNLLAVVTDAIGRTTTFSLNNGKGTGDAPTTPDTSLPAPSVSPAGPFTLACGISTAVFVTQTIPTGYTGTTPVVTAASTEPARVSASLASGVLTITRLANGPTGLDTVIVRVSNGVKNTDLTVTMAGNTPFGCGTGGGAGGALSTTAPAIMTLAATTTVSPITITGGTPPYSVSTNSPTRVRVSTDGNTGTNGPLSLTTVPYVFFVHGVATGFSFVTITDSSAPALNTVILVQVP